MQPWMYTLPYAISRHCCTLCSPISHLSVVMISRMFLRLQQSARSKIIDYALFRLRLWLTSLLSCCPQLAAITDKHTHTHTHTHIHYIQLVGDFVLVYLKIHIPWNSLLCALYVVYPINLYAYFLLKLFS